MARTKQEVRDFLNLLVGQMVNEKCGIYNGQCVSLIKALLEFLGAPNPYAGRGNAKDVGDTLLRQGLAANSKGWLNVCINRDMGTLYEPTLGKYVNYGHIWLDLTNEVNFEQNGNRALITTKNTRPISQAQQIVNLDQYITEGDTMESKVDRGGLETIWRGFLDRAPTDAEYKEYVGKNWATVLFTAIKSPEYKDRMAGLVKLVTVTEPALRKQVKDLQAQIDAGGGGNCTADERAFLDTMYKIVTKKG